MARKRYFPPSIPTPGNGLSTPKPIPSPSPHPPNISNGGSSTPKQNANNPQAKLRIFRTLDGYTPGEYNHKGIDNFIKLIMSDLSKSINFKNNRSIAYIQIIGYADGMLNLERKKWEDVNPKYNPRNQRGKITDDNLAEIRSLIIQESLKVALGTSILRKTSITSDHKDIPTGGKSGDDIRRVTVEIILRDF